MTQILVFGDSIVYGAWDIEGGWVQRLRKFLDQRVIDSNYKEDFIVYNLGVGGDTSKDLLKRFESETKHRLWPDSETIFILSVGDNDSIFNNKTKSFRVLPEDYEKNLQKILNLTKKYSTKILFVGSIPVDESKVDEIPWFLGHSYKNKYINQFSEIAKSICKKNKCYFIDIHGKLEKENYKKLLADGVHPNSRGHEKVFEVVKDFLIKENVL